MTKITPKIEKQAPRLHGSGTIGISIPEREPPRGAVRQRFLEGRSRPDDQQPGAALKASTEVTTATLRFHNPAARKVFAAGNFNDWRVDTTPLTRAGNGEWVLNLALRPGTYEYRFVVDGQWCDDPLARERVKNPHGGWNAILRIEPRVIRLPEHLPH